MAKASYRNSVEEFVYMTEGGYNKEEILKGERIILQVRRGVVPKFLSTFRADRAVSDYLDPQVRHLVILFAIQLGSKDLQGR